MQKCTTLSLNLLSSTKPNRMQGKYVCAFVYTSQCEVQKGSNTKHSIAVSSYYRKVETSQQATISTQHTSRRYLEMAAMSLVCKAQNKQQNLCLYLASQSQLRLTYNVDCPEKLQNALKNPSAWVFSLST